MAVQKQEKYLIQFNFVDLSGFHGNGRVIWMDVSGFTIVQLADDPKFKGKNCIFKFQMDKKILDTAMTLFKDHQWSDVRAMDRQPNSDDVRIYTQFRNESGQMRSVEVWWNDWDRQPALIKKIKDLADLIVDEAKKNKPTKTESIKPGELKVQWPYEFEAIPPASVQKKEPLDDMSMKDIIVIIKSIQQKFPFKSVDEANRVLVSDLKKFDSNDSFTMYESDSKISAVKRIEFRANFISDQKRQFLIVDLKNPVVTKGHDYEKQLGSKDIQKMGFTTTHPVKGRDRETYTTLKFDGLKINLVFNQGEDISSFTFDSM